MKGGVRMMSSSLQRPKLAIPKTTGEKIADIIGYGAYIGALVFLLYHWQRLPDEVPAHYNAVGEVDRWGSKMELFILPVVGFFLALFMQMVERFPETHNYPARLNEQNAHAFYTLSRKLTNQLKNSSLVIFSLLTIQTVLIAQEKLDSLSSLFLPFFMVVVCAPIVICLVKQRRIQ